MSEKVCLPALSICVAIYNVEKYLDECLSSLVKIRNENIEFILVNDGSTDNSLVICENYLKKDRRFKLISHPNNKTLIQARKTGIEIASGDYILFLDGDDKINPVNLDTLLSILKKDKSDIIQFEVCCFGNENYYLKNYIEHFKIKNNSKTFDLRSIRLEIFYNHSIPWNVFNKVYKTSIAKQAANYIGLLKFTSGEDAFITFVITHLATSYSSSPLQVYCYRLGTGISNGKETIEKFSIHTGDLRIPLLLKNSFSNNRNEEFDTIAIEQLDSSLKELTVKRFWKLDIKDKYLGLNLLRQERLSYVDFFKKTILIIIKFISLSVFPVGSKRRNYLKNFILKRLYYLKT